MRLFVAACLLLTTGAAAVAGQPVHTQINQVDGAAPCASVGQTTVLSGVCSQAHASEGQQYQLDVGIEAGPGQGDKVAGYFGAKSVIAKPGEIISQIWAINPLTFCQHGSGGCIADETDLNNQDCDPGPIDAPFPGCKKAFIGKLITGASVFPMGSAINISAVVPQGQGWRTGLSAVGPVVIDDLIHDESGSTVSYEIKGPHAVGVDMMSARIAQAAIRLGYGQPEVWAGPQGNAALSASSDGFELTAAGKPVLRAGPGGARAASFTVAALPKACAPGSMVYVSDARKNQERPGEGAGNLAFCDGRNRWYMAPQAVPVSR